MLHIRHADLVPQAFALLIMLFASASAEAQHLAFSTSVSGPADLSTWADAGGLEGLEAADRICQQRAQAAGHSGTFVAVLSDSTDDAWCRLHGLSGKRSANCGQPELPNDAGPWVRTDGFPVGGTLEEMSGFFTFGYVWVPLHLDELGELVPFDYWTGSTYELSYQTNQSCLDWTSVSTALFGAMGNSYGTRHFWINGGSWRCDQDRHLLCMEPGPGPVVEIPPAEGALVFYQPSSVAADFGSLEAADAICQAAAAGADVPDADRFMAWLSDSTTNAIDRFTWDGPWQRPDGVPVALNQADLTDGALFAPINVDLSGLYYSLFVGVWTSTKPDGSRTATNCLDWTSTSAAETSEALQSVAVADTGWTLFNNGLEDATWSCTTELGFYCFGQVAFDPGIFADGFESGSTDAWSSSNP